MIQLFASDVDDGAAATAIKGIVDKIGWTSTTIRASNDHVVSVSNRYLNRQLIRNLSRSNVSHVHQTLRFLHKDAHKLPAFLKGIKDEIRLACPAVIADGSLRAYWTNLEEDYLRVDVDAHFAIPTSASMEYLENRQRVLQAIHRAVKIHQLEYYGTAPVMTSLAGTPAPSAIAYRNAGEGNVFASSRPQHPHFGAGAAEMRPTGSMGERGTRQ